MATPYVTHIEDRVHSTQDFARTEFSTTGHGMPVLVIARSQDAGRGRADNPWWNPPNAMLASVALSSPAVEHVTLAPLAAGMAAHDAIASQLGVATGLKWPNDIMMEDAKVGGILSERDESSLVVGCGLNLWWPDAPEGAGALLDSDPGRQAAVDLALAWAARLLNALDDLATGFDRSAYVAVCDTIGHRITWTPAGEGRAIGITVDGALIVETAQGQEVLRSGAVRHVRRA
jgi:BirA family biotin operon repressor/biotin-[acetyl-CoA-carboxylase] ligase